MPKLHKSHATKLFTVEPNICISSTWNLLHVAHWVAEMAPRFLESLCTPALYSTYKKYNFRMKHSEHYVYDTKRMHTAISCLKDSLPCGVPTL